MISDQILQTLKEEQIGYAAMGCALALARLSNSDMPITPLGEIKFVGALMEWVDSYFTIPVSGTVH